MGGAGGKVFGRFALKHGEQLKDVRIQSALCLWKTEAGGAQWNINGQIKPKKVPLTCLILHLNPETQHPELLWKPSGL